MRVVTVLALSVITAIVAVLLAIWLAVLLDDATDDLRWLTGIAVAFTTWAILSALTTILTLRRKILQRMLADGDDVLVRIANSNIRRELFRLFELTALAGLGITILTVHSSPWSGRIIILFVTILLGTNAFRDAFEDWDTDLAIKAELRARRRREEMR